MSGSPVASRVNTSRRRLSVGVHTALERIIMLAAMIGTDSAGSATFRDPFRITLVHT